MNIDLLIEKKNRHLKIKDLYVNKKYNALIKEATIYLDMFPNDLNIRFMRAKAYRKNKMFNEAISDLKYNLNIEKDNEHSLVELYYLYYYLNMYKEALEILPILYEKRAIIATSLVISEMVMKKSLGISVKTKETGYVIDQINDYSKEEALKHINKHTLEPNDGPGKKRSKFNDNIDINYLYEIVKENIDNTKKANIQEILEVHFFSLYNVGYDENNVCNFIKVIVIPNTNNIISIYPINNLIDSEYNLLNYDRDKLFKTESKVKTLSRIDRFKKKYNM